MADPSQKIGNGARSALILVVERDPHVRNLERYFLERAGYSVQFAQDGMEALAKARAIVPQIMITEILVPGLDGLSVCRQLKDDAKTHKVVVLVFSILAAESRALEAGADAFLRKPLNETLLVQSVERLIAKQLTGGITNGAA